MSVKTNAPMPAASVVRALRARHRNDVFVTELSTASSHRRMDAWAMPRSWSKWTTVGYEIKVTRSDFLRDAKWQDYLDYCHEFYFAVPWGLIDPKEVGDGAGLVYITKTGSARVKLAAPRRKIEFPAGLFKRLVMNSNGFSTPWGGVNGEPVDSLSAREERIAEFKRRLVAADDGRDLARMLKGEIKAALRDSEQRAQTAESKLRSLEALRRGLVDVGLTENDIEGGRWSRRRALEKVRAVAADLHPELAKDMRSVATTLTRIADKVGQ